jgi:hypothetical protein
MRTLMQRRLQMRMELMLVESSGNVVFEDPRQLQAEARLLQIHREYGTQQLTPLVAVGHLSSCIDEQRMDL